MTTCVYRVKGHSVVDLYWCLLAVLPSSAGAVTVTRETGQDKLLAQTTCHFTPRNSRLVTYCSPHMFILWRNLSQKRLFTPPCHQNKHSHLPHNSHTPNGITCYIVCSQRKVYQSLKCKTINVKTVKILPLALIQTLDIDEECFKPSLLADLDFALGCVLCKGTLR